MLQSPKYKWLRARTKKGTIYYYAHIDESVIVQIWLDKGKWNWVLIGWPSPTSNDPGPLVLRQGYAKTLEQARVEMESLLPQHRDEQITWMDL